MSEEQGFHVSDRRRVRHPDDVEATAVPEEPEPEAEPVSAGESIGAAEAGETGTVPEITTRGFLWYAISWLEERAWVAMGLRPDPVSGKVGRDLADARLAIDLLSDLMKHAETGAPAEVKRELQVMISNLQVNYVRQSEQG